MGEASLTWQDRVFEYYQGDGKDDLLDERVVQEFNVAVNAIVSDMLSSVVKKCLFFGADMIDIDLKDQQTCLDRLRGLEPGELDVISKGVAELFTKEKLPGRDIWKNRLNWFLRDPFFNLTAVSEKRVMTGAPGSMYKFDYPDSDMQAQVRATVAAWHKPYKGDIAAHLWRYVAEKHHAERYMSLPGAAIVQASGAGKSRAVDQLATEHFVISICLREEYSRGFPPPDKGVSDYLKDAMRQEDHARRIDSFVIALFSVALEKVKELAGNATIASISGGVDKYVALARSFRRRMSEGMGMWVTNEYRTAFFAEVLAKTADEGTSRMCTTWEAAAQLQRFLASLVLKQAPEDGSTRSDSGKTWRPTELDSLVPLTIVAFDRASVLTHRISKNIPPVLPTLLKRLSFLKRTSTFFLFLSTSSQITDFLSRSAPDAWGKIQRGRSLSNVAFTGCAFDLFALKSEEDVLTIQTVAGEDYMSHLGRPLWATRVDSPQNSDDRFNMREDLMSFAASKLLLMMTLNPIDTWKLDIRQNIACLCHRLPIDFACESYALQRELVENYMRICLWLNPEEVSMASTSSSEPLLAEAAAIGMNCPECDFEAALEVIMANSPIHKEDLGEIVVALLMLLARDSSVFCEEKNNSDMWLAAVRQTDPLGGRAEDELKDYNRVLTVHEFISNLLTSMPVDILNGIKDDFAGAYMHFNHYVKVLTRETLECRFLMRMLARGAALTCVDLHESIDVLNPILFGDTLRRDCMSSIMIQVKNDARYGATPDYMLHDTMDPIELGVLGKQGLPVIRIVFALASKESSISARRVVYRNADSSVSFVAYDIWCAGLSPKVLKPIQKRVGEEAHKEAHWWKLAAQSRRWEEIYRPSGTEKPMVYLQEMTPAVAHEEPFWNFFPSTLGDN